MTHGSLILRFSDDGDGTGKLLATAESGGFSGLGGAYFAVSEIERFASAISQCPLPERERCSIASGFCSRAKPGILEQEHLGIQVYPIDSRGHIGVQVRVSTELWDGMRPESQQSSKVEIITTYQALAEFSEKVLAITRGSVKEAILSGQTFD